jgi:hypothetical protein
LRALALAAEMEGEIAVAAEHYRRADPLATTEPYTESELFGLQIRGLIRTTERSSGCGPVVPERLLDWDRDHPFERRMTPDARAQLGYGPDRLAAAGFDVPRLYRGARVTHDREARTLQAAIDRGPVELRSPALSRLARVGLEAWHARIGAP